MGLGTKLNVKNKFGVLVLELLSFDVTLLRARLSCIETRRAAQALLTLPK